MGKGKSGLKKSTIITMVSCGSLIVTTFIALLFFIKFPITPSEKIMASIGRESIYRSNNVEGLEVTTTTTQTTTATQTSVSTYSQTTTTSTTHTDFVITITTGKGFLTGGRIPTVPYMPEENISDYSDYTVDTTTVTDDYDYDSQTYTEPDYNNYDNSYDYSYDNSYDYSYDYNYDWSY